MTTVREYLHGIGLFGRALRLYLRTPRLLRLGLVPTVLSGMLFVGALAVLLAFLPDLAQAATWFAEDWSPTARTLAIIVAGIGILVAALLVMVFGFSAVTLAIGDPFYERISAWVEQSLGGVADEVARGFWRELSQSLLDSARLFLLATVVGVVLFFAGLVPVAGQTVVPVLAATVGGWFLALELVGAPFSRRGLRLADRRRRLGARRARALGFGTTVFVCFLIPGGAVLLMPAAVIGGTLLAREVLPPSQATPEAT